MADDFDASFDAALEQAGGGDQPADVQLPDVLHRVTDTLRRPFHVLPPSKAGLALIAAGLDILPAAHCGDCYRQALQQVRAEVDRLLAEGAN